jgi:alpha-tubulin suppressor-like RCC1 family protein
VLRRVLTLVVVGLSVAAAAGAEQASQPGSVAAGGLDLGAYHSCALLSDATVRCWGYGTDGALGYGNPATIGDDETPASAGPVDIGDGRTATALSAGSVHTCARLDNGTVRCWGFGGNGRLGSGNTDNIGDNETPAVAGTVNLGAERTAAAVTAGRGHTCVVLDNGSVDCWGFGADGRLGYGNTDSIGDNETPGEIGPVNLGTARTATAITAGEAHTCALLDDGTVRCWGANASGQLGYGNTTPVGDDETPDTAGPVKLGTGRTAVAITAGSFHTCALLDNATVRCWGFGRVGALGYGNTDSIGANETPDVTGPVNLGAERRATAISAGAFHTCALLDNGAVRCWGFGRAGRLGYANANSVGDDETPDTVGPVDLGTGRAAVAVSTGETHSCARLDDGSVRCWGHGANGRLGYCSIDDIGDDETPGSFGPVDLGVPGAFGAGCTTGPTPASAPPTSSDSAPVPPAATRPPPSTDFPAASQRLRARALRSCLRRVTRRATIDRIRARRRAEANRRAALRRVARNAKQRRRICMRLHGRTPGAVGNPLARAVGLRAIRLSFRAAGTDGSRPPAARRYIVKQSRRPIRSAREFRRGQSLCGGTCSFDVTDVGATVTLTVTDLQRRTLYYYAIAARDNVSGRAGRRSHTLNARTR